MTNLSEIYPILVFPSDSIIDLIDFKYFYCVDGYKQNYISYENKANMMNIRMKTALKASIRSISSSFVCLRSSC